MSDTETKLGADGVAYMEEGGYRIGVGMEPHVVHVYTSSQTTLCDEEDHDDGLDEFDDDLVDLSYVDTPEALGWATGTWDWCWRCPRTLKEEMAEDG